MALAVRILCLQNAALIQPLELLSAYTLPRLSDNHFYHSSHSFYFYSFFSDTLYFSPSRARIALTSSAFKYFTPPRSFALLSMRCFAIRIELQPDAASRSF